jgi:hypothetical protein
MASQSYPVSKPLWDAVESALLAKSRDLILDLAKALNQEPKPLLDAFRAKKHSVHLVDISDPTEDRWQCEALLSENAVAQRCRKPVVLGSCYCPVHEHNHPPVPEKPVLRRIVTDDGTTYFLDALTQQIYTQDYQRVGWMDDGKIILLEET